MVKLVGLVASCLLVVACEDVPCDGACGVDEVCERIVACGPFGFLESDRLDDCVAPRGCTGGACTCETLCGDDCGDDATCVEGESRDGVAQVALIYSGCID